MNMEFVMPSANAVALRPFKPVKASAKLCRRLPQMPAIAQTHIEAVLFAVCQRGYSLEAAYSQVANDLGVRPHKVMHDVLVYSSPDTKKRLGLKGLATDLPEKSVYLNRPRWNYHYTHEGREHPWLIEECLHQILLADIGQMIKYGTKVAVACWQWALTHGLAFEAVHITWCRLYLNSMPRPPRSCPDL